MTLIPSRVRKPRLTDKVLEGALTALGAAEAGPGESCWTKEDHEAIAAALNWVRGMKQYRARRRSEETVI